MIFVKRSFTSFSLFHEHMYYNPKQFYIPCLFIEFLEIPLLSLLYKKSSTTEGSKIFVSRKRYFIRRVFRNACAVNVIACQIIKSKLYACDIWALSRCLWNILALVWIVTFSVWGAEQEILRFFFFFFFFSESGWKMNWLKPFFLFAKDISINTEWQVNKVPV